MNRPEQLAGFVPTPHPVLKLPETADEARALMNELGGVEGFTDWLLQREELIRLERLEPYRHGCYLEHWRDADRLLETNRRLLVLGGNRSAKSQWAARTAVRLMEEKPEARIMCLQTTGPNSVALQQPYVHKYLPAEWQSQPKGQTTQLKYSRKGGFTENTFVAPNGSQCWFYNYAQDIDVLEGWELDLVWADELVPWTWVETLGYRLVTRGGLLIVTFTPVKGYNMTIKQICDGATVTEWRPAALLPDTVNIPQGPVGRMPYRLAPVNPNWAVIFFHSIMNPFGNYAELVKECAGKDRSHIMIRAYGWAEKGFGDLFPLFGAVNIVEPETIPERGTNYCIVDPAGGRNWFILWVRVDEFGRHWLYREWPDVATFGEWAVPSEDAGKFDGAPGPAQRNLGYGVAEYKQLLRRLEGVAEDDPGERILQRLMDPRAGSAQTQADNKGGTCLLDKMSEEQFDRDGTLTGPALPFLGGSGVNLDEKIGAINDLLAWDPKRPREPLLNEPRLFVNRHCRNTIWALQNWTGRDGLKGACKDPVDCVGMAAAGDLSFADDEALSVTGGGAYG